ncbi:MAG: hypothetical protein KDC98_06085 [Planctomycetes bacterium]|nr:hypothetical protein [Planctomycetota bacterium]
MSQRVPDFPAQRIVFLALLLGMTGYAIAAAVVLQSNDGHGLAEHAVPALDTTSIVVGICTTLTALLTRTIIHNRAKRLEGRRRQAALFRSRLVPLVLLEGGCLLGITVWLLNGRAVPGLATAMVLLAIAIAITPFTDPDATTG